MSVPREFRTIIGDCFAVLNDYWDRQQCHSQHEKECWEKLKDILPGLLTATDTLPEQKIREFIQAERVTRRMTK